MSVLSFLRKEFREHLPTLLLLLVGYVLVLLIAVQQTQGAAFFMSNMQVVRLSLISIVPLCIYLLGNILLVREYINKTMQFLEALPLKISQILCIKFLFGLMYCWLLVFIAMFIVKYSAHNSEMITSRYLLLVGVKSVSIATLYWSIVFCISLFGKVRFVLYAIILLFVFLILGSPYTDKTLVAPIALFEYKEFVFERDIIPWSYLIQTLAISGAFLMVAFLMVTVNDGSIVERLSKPMSRRDFAGLLLIVLSGLTVFGSVSEKWNQESFEFDSNNVLKSTFPRVDVSYLDPDNLPMSEEVLEEVRAMLQRFQVDTGIEALPSVRIVLDEERDPFNVSLEHPDGILIRANYTGFEQYGLFVLKSYIMHGTLSMLTDARFVFEPTHWLMDGLSQWWAVSDKTVEPEVYAKAIYAVQNSLPSVDLFHHWELTGDRHGDSGSGAIAYSAISYLTQIAGAEKVAQLATHYLTASYSSTSIESFSRLFTDHNAIFEQFSGLPFGQFVDQWALWLMDKKSEPAIAAMLNSIPNLSGHVEATIGESGEVYLQGQYAAMDENQHLEDASCTLRYEWVGAFDYQLSLNEADAHESACNTDSIAHVVEVSFAEGERVYTTLDVQPSVFHEPLIMWSGRVLIP